jgi:hypothetical protein
MYKSLAIGAAALLTLTGCAPVDTSAKDASCINLIVDYSTLNPTGNFSECITVNSDVSALSFVTNAGFTIDGTDKYGNQIVCRVNDFPSATKAFSTADKKNYVEPCKDMPPAFAYWALLVKTPDKKWGWAESGIGDLKLSPGDSLALVFSEDGNTKFPNE